MNSKLTPRIIILIIALILAFLAISPTFKSGAFIKSVPKNSTAFNEGLRGGMIITEVNGQKIESVEDYTRAMTRLFSNQTNLTKIEIKTQKNGEFIFLTDKAPEITIGDIPKSRIKTGLDLSGGARAVIKPKGVELSSEEIQDLVAVTNERLNAFGITDITVRSAKDLGGTNYMIIEVAGATPADLQELVGKQGKFEAKIGNVTVFEGGERDISDVCRNDASCAAITGCQQQSGAYYCRFNFVIYLTETAAKKHADITSNISLDESGDYLSEKLYLYLDNNEVDSLLISSDLKGRVATQISIQGSGTGKTQEEALKDAKESMKRLQTILITGSLPYELEIVKLDTISPALGKEFTKNLIVLGLSVFGIICIILFVRYRKIKITLAVIMTVFSEAFITLGIAALIKWNLDAPSIAGIIVGMGTGINDQIVLIDEAVTDVRTSSLKERIKRALFIIIGAFLTIIAAMLPLFWAGAGLLRGFALTTIIGVTVGILITRPAFADVLKKITE